jgi:hypothetical protein
MYDPILHNLIASQHLRIIEIHGPVRIFPHLNRLIVDTVYDLPIREVSRVAGSLDGVELQVAGQGVYVGVRVRAARFFESAVTGGEADDIGEVVEGVGEIGAG